MKTEDGMGGKNSVSQESEKARKVSSNQLSRLPAISKRNSKQKLARTDKSELSKALSREAKQLFNLPARSLLLRTAKGSHQKLTMW